MTSFVNRYRVKRYRRGKNHFSQSQKCRGLTSGLRLTFCAILGNLLHSLALSLFTWQIRERQIKGLMLAHPIAFSLLAQHNVPTSASTFPNLPYRCSWPHDQCWSVGQKPKLFSSWQGSQEVLFKRKLTQPAGSPSTRPLPSSSQIDRDCDGWCSSGHLVTTR